MPSCPLAHVILPLFLLAACGGEERPNVMPDGELPSSMDLTPPPRLDGGAPPPPDSSPPPKPDSAPTTKCTGQEQPFNGQCYLAVGYKWMDYTAASQLCAANNGKVASVLSAAENKFILSLLAPLNQGAWIGLRRKNGKFAWVDGHPLSYTNWTPGEPNNEKGAENCTVMWGPHLDKAAWRGKWNDVPCDNPGRDTVVCKRKP